MDKNKKIILTFDADYQFIKSQIVCDLDLEEMELAKIESKISECLKNGCKCLPDKNAA